jgi:hypothetical protein
MSSGGAYLRRERVGRQNQYRLEPLLHLRHPLEHHVKVGRLLAVLEPGTAAREKSVCSPRGTAVVTARGPTGVRSRANAKAILRKSGQKRAIR